MRETWQECDSEIFIAKTSTKQWKGFSIKRGDVVKKMYRIYYYQSINQSCISNIGPSLLARLHETEFLSTFFLFIWWCMVKMEWRVAFTLLGVIGDDHRLENVRNYSWNYYQSPRNVLQILRIAALAMLLLNLYNYTFVFVVLNELLTKAKSCMASCWCIHYTE